MSSSGLWWANYDDDDDDDDDDDGDDEISLAYFNREAFHNTMI
jgi:hypothetical protein